MKLSHLLLRRCLLSAVFTLSALSALAQNSVIDTRPVVHLELIDREAAETHPFQDAIFWGEFRVVRSGPTTDDLIVFLGTDGTAVLGQDYRLDRMTNGASITFRAGQSAINVRLYPIDDDLKEGDETALIRLVPPPYGGPLPDPYRIAPDRSSVTIVIHDNEPLAPVVSIVATQPVAEESSYPLRRLPLRGEFTISRSGPTNTALSVFVLYSGTATPDVDYPAQPWLVTIPEGVSAIRFAIEPKDDGIAEGTETVVATLSHCPPDYLDIPCYGGFEIDSRRGRAVVSIRDNAVADATLTITNPREGATFPLGETILIEATASDPEGYISRVEFFDGDRSIGVSEINFIQAPDPGTPIHHSLEWSGAAIGRHTLTARAIRTDGSRIVSPPVNIVVAGGESPRIAIVQPLDGTQFPADANIEIVAEAVDPDGYVPRVEFFADGRKIGEVNLEFIRPPDPGETQKFSFTWRYALPGRHVLTAIATDDARNRTPSAPVGIYVATTNLLPVVNVEAPDPYAVEPQSNTVLNTATFRIRRHGPTNDPLVVAYSLHGTAGNGTDYERLPGLVTIPAGSRGALVIVRPLVDNLVEGTESVRIHLEEPPPSTDTTRVINPYLVGRAASAGAIISDYPLTTRSRWLADNLMLVSFTADTGGNFRIEATSDFRTWETICDAASADSACHFIDTDADRHAARFYRLTPEPVLAAAE